MFYVVRMLFTASCIGHVGVKWCEHDMLVLQIRIHNYKDRSSCRHELWNRPTIDREAHIITILICAPVPRLRMTSTSSSSPPIWPCMPMICPPSGPCRRGSHAYVSILGTCFFWLPSVTVQIYVVNLKEHGGLQACAVRLH